MKIVHQRTRDIAYSVHEEPPGTIPNSEVIVLSADDSGPPSPCENRAPPGFKSNHRWFMSHRGFLFSSLGKPSLFDGLGLSALLRPWFARKQVSFPRSRLCKNSRFSRHDEKFSHWMRISERDMHQKDREMIIFSHFCKRT